MYEQGLFGSLNVWGQKYLVYSKKQSLDRYMTREGVLVGI